LDETGQKEIDGVAINFLPSAVYAYNVGLTTIIHQYNKLM
jgi:hypothetical protein